MKIISGRLKGHKILTKSNMDYRPTKAHVKEAIFSILQSGNSLGEERRDFIRKAKVLDVFAGTGALGFESISRGAESLSFVEINPENIKLLEQNIRKLSLLNVVNIIRGDSTKLPKADKKHDLIFLDPPFHKDFVEPTIDSLGKGGWIASGACIVIETEKSEKYEISEKFSLFVERIYGCARLRIYRYEHNE